MTPGAPHSNGDDVTDETVELERGGSRGPWLLEIGSQETSGATILRVGERITLGSGRYADLRVSDPAVSARHCGLQAVDGGVKVEDFGSTNGVFVGPARIGGAVLLEADASFVIGGTSVTLRLATGKDPACEALPIAGLVGSSAPMLRVADEIRRHAPRRAPVLLQGESGTGKDVAARALHALGHRPGLYVPLNASAFPEGLADAELFGHLRGAFTGAISQRAGAFEQAHRGTLFLDEVAELSPAVQVKLLRVVEDGLIRPIGAAQPLRIEVRLLSATWAELDERVVEGRFRADLYHRLSTVVIRMPTLRERKSDIPALCAALLARLKEDVGPKRLEPQALAKLVAYAWPGNVRELGSVLYRAAVDSNGDRIEAFHIVLPTRSARSRVRAVTEPIDAVSLLKAHAGNVSAAARTARVPRSTFRSWLDRARVGGPRSSTT
jgi:DNA-binding NtrC family response regulator